MYDPVSGISAIRSISIKPNQEDREPGDPVQPAETVPRLQQDKED